MMGDLPFFKLMVLLSVGHSTAELCDRASRAQEREGNLGQSADFNWLGVLHVKIHELIATSGIVLIKIKYALVNADDVARIPQHIFRLRSKAMFLPARNNTWFVKLASYITHPEYELSNINTIAIIELDLNGIEDFPLTPICLATAKTFEASRYLYLTGFTHENDELEKVIYKIQYLEKKVCEEFYNKSEFSSHKPIPSAQLCGYAPNSASQCIWNNGMTLISNSFGYLNLVGFSVHGPGCTAPTRFIDLFPYFNWINAITSSTPSNRQDFVTKSGRRQNIVQNIPIHELYKVASRRQLSEIIGHMYEAYPKQLYNTEFHLIEPDVDNRTFFISAAKDSWGKNESACSEPKELMYHEHFELRAVDKLWGKVTYKLSMYDAHQSLSCVILNVDCTKHSKFIIKFKEMLNFKEDTDTTGVLWYNTPEEIFRYYPEHKIKESEPDKNIHGPSFVEDETLFREGLYYDLYITFEFLERGQLKFEMYSPQKQKTTITTTTTVKPTDASKVIRRGRTKVKVKQKSRWGVENWADHMLREAEMSVEEEEVYGTESEVRGEGEQSAARGEGEQIAARGEGAKNASRGEAAQSAARGEGAKSTTRGGGCAGCLVAAWISSTVMFTYYGLGI